MWPMQVEITVGSAGRALRLALNKLKVGKDLAYHAYTHLYETGISPIQVRSIKYKEAKTRVWNYFVGFRRKEA